IVMNLYLLLKIIAVLLSGMEAGLFYAFQYSIVNGLGLLSDKAYLLSVQAINKAILNAVFDVSSMGCLVVLPIASWLTYRNGDSAAFIFLLAATALYFAGVFGVTIFGNVPLNETLARFNIHAATPKELASLRELFEYPWNRYNLIRTIAAIISFLLTILSILKIK